MKTQRAWKYKLDLNKAQKQILSLWLSHLRCLYNIALAQRIIAWNSQHRKSINFYDQANELPELKKEFPFFRDVPAQLLQQKLKDVESAYKKFFSGGGFPRFKKKRDASGMRFPDAKQFKIEKSKTKRTSFVTLPKIGKVKFLSHREIIGEIKNCTISKDKCGDFYISFQTEYEMPVFASDKKHALGADRGITNNVTTSDGQVFEMPLKEIKRLETKIAKRQKSLSRKKKGSKNFEKDLLKINKFYRKITRIKCDTTHKITSDLTNNHGFIAIEDLKTKNMMASASGTIEEPGRRVRQKSGLNRSIARQNWGEFDRALTYKSAWRGVKLVKVKSHYTSQECNKCHHVDSKNRNKESFKCVKCGHTDHADINGAKNILAAGHAVTVCGETSFGASGKTTSRNVSAKQKPILKAA